MEEHSLIKELKDGDNDGFRYVYEKYKEKLFSYVFYKIKNKSEAEDLVQEIFTKLYKNIGLYDENQSTFYNFLLSNANQVIAEYSRKNISREQRAEKVHLDYDIASDDKVFAVYDKFEGEYNIEELLNELPPDQREVFILVCIKHMSYKDAERLLNKSDLSVKSLLFRARSNLRKKIAKRYPEVAREYGFKKALKMIVISCVCVGAIGGFTYATWRAYQSSHYKNTFTIADTKQDIQEQAEDVISKERACMKINENLQVLGINVIVNQDDLHLLRDYKSDEVCWEYKNDNILIDVDAQRGRLINYSDLNGSVSTIEFSENLLNKLNVKNGYEIMSDEIVDGNRIVEYAKKYGNIFNKYQSTTVIIRNNRVLNISSVYYEYEDKEILVSKEEAIKILKDNGIEVSADDVELAIENVGVINSRNTDELNESILYENSRENMLNREKMNIKKVWKIYNKNVSYYIDANTGEFLFSENMFNFEKE